MDEEIVVLGHVSRDHSHDDGELCGALRLNCPRWFGLENQI